MESVDWNSKVYFRRRRLRLKSPVKFIRIFNVCLVRIDSVTRVTVQHHAACIFCL